MNDEALLPSRICTALMRMGTRMATEFDHQVKPRGITQSQFRILLAIWEQGGEAGIAPSVLAEHLLIERGTVSVLTNAMLDKGWLERRPGPNRRTFRLVLTPVGADLLQQAIPHAVRLANHTLAGLPTAELRQIEAIFQRIEAQLRTYEPLLEVKQDER